MSRSDVLKILKEFKEEHAEEYGILLMGIFGSVARDQATGNSDVDVVVKMNKPDLLTLSRMRIELEEQMHVHVDIINYREKMNDFLKKRIDREAVYV
ncbi:nucleotidyltransferase domain protein [bacterium BMS3Bbin08]|nr:nucleotidyltransferase domain protein [bacterium BMS3Bbin08]